MPEYEHRCNGCGYEFADTYSIKADPPKTCPECKKDEVQRLISGGSGKGIVSLTGNDLVAKVKADAAAIENFSSKSESYSSNFIGDGLYQKKQVEMDSAKKNGVFRRSR